MKRRITALCAALLFLAACSGAPSDSRGTERELKIGMVLINNESDNGYSYNHMVGLREAAEALQIPDADILVERDVPETEDSVERIRALADAGCDVVFVTSYGHEPYMLKLAKYYPDVCFAHCSGYASAADDLPNTSNYFAKIFEARWLSGIAAGLKAKEINNPKLGYVGAFDIAEVISGYTAFLLGARSVYPEAELEVIYTMDWTDAGLDAQAARKLVERGAGVISQHSDTTAPALIAEEAGIFHVGYNSDMVGDAPNASLLSARVRWSVYYKYVIETLRGGGSLPPDNCVGFAEGAVYLSPLNEAIAAPGTAEALENAERELINGFRVFSGPLTGSNGADRLDLKAGEFYDESGERSEPSFDYIIPGVTVSYLR